MRGLLIKDICILKKYYITLIPVLIVYGIVQIMSPESSWFSAMLIMFGAFTPQSTFSYDELANWDHYVLSLPITKKEVVQSKYIFSIVNLFTAFLIGSLAGLIFQVGIAHVSIKESFFANVAVLAVALFFLAVILPLFIKMGQERARFFIIAAFMIPAIIVVLLSKSEAFKNLPVITNGMIEKIVLIGLVFCILCMILSYFISVLLYEKKEI